MKKFLRLYSNSLWIPFILAIGAYLVSKLLIVFFSPYSMPLNFRILIGFVPTALYLLSIIGMFIVGISQLIRRAWMKGIINFVLIPFSFLFFIFTSGFLGFLNMGINFGKDNFGKDIKIPEGMRVESVIDGNPWGEQKEKEEDVLLATSLVGNPDLIDEFLKKPRPVLAAKDYPVIENIWFPEISGEKRNILLRHLAASCRWRLSRGWDGALFATRRFIVNGQWQGDDYYGDVQGKAVFIFPDRIAEFARGNLQGYKTYAKAGTEPIKLKLTKLGDNTFPPYVSELSLSSGKSIIEIHDTDGQSTQKLLYFLKDELEDVLNSEIAKNKGFDTSLMPDFSIRKGDAEIEVFKTPAYSSPGHYTINAFVNPGDEGYVYLKVFEATTDTSLDVRWDSVEYTGWSDNPDEKFFYSYSLVIYAGQPNWSYPARFELWLKPADPKKPERKLIEKIYSVSGWEH
jgi:hypothetical protein